MTEAIIAAANIGITFGSLAGGMAIDGSAATAPVITGLVIAVLAIPVAWATSALKPPAVEEPHTPAPTHEPA